MTPIETTALDTSVKTAQTFFGKIFGPATDELGMQLADNMRLRRMKNQLKNLDKVRKIVEEENVTMKQIDLKALFPLLEATALEENENLQEMWANLFTNYIDAAKTLTNHVYPDILRQLSSDEVEILKIMEANRNTIVVINRRELVGKPNERYAYLDELANLIRLGIVEGIPRIKNEGANAARRHMFGTPPTQNDPVVKLMPPKTYLITDFGQQFLEACTR